jgi:uncharacterized protein
MPVATFSTTLPVSSTDAFAWHARAGAFDRLTPPWLRLRAEQQLAPGATSIIENGGLVQLTFQQFPWISWLAEHHGYQPPHQFIDRQKTGPFRSYEHTHRFAPRADGCELTDQITYEHGLLTGLRSSAIARDFQRTFAFRHERTIWDLRRHHAAALSPQRILLTGASGLIGTQLRAFLSTGGHHVSTIGRGKSATYQWDMKQNIFPEAALQNCDAVIHLAGENIAQRWSARNLDNIYHSRIHSTAMLAERLSKMPSPPKTLIIASGIGYYGTHDDDGERDETAAPGHDIPADICQKWEAAAEPARARGIRVVHVRLGMVISQRGGALQKMLPAFRAGAGGPIGSGQQWQSWIHLDDAIDIFHRALWDNSLSGIINAVAPETLRQKSFAQQLGQALRRPAFMPLPGFAVAALFGQMGRTLLLAGTRVKPARLQTLGHTWRFPTFAQALATELGNYPA